MALERIKKSVVKEVDTVVGEKLTCDICNKIIYLKKEEDEKPEIDNPYYSTTTGHHEWGNDSVESIKCNDVCSDECLAVVMTEYMERVKEYPSQYLNIDGNRRYI